MQTGSDPAPRRFRDLALWGLLGLSLLLLWQFSPPERTLGTGIRPVYVHVGLIWTGMIGLIGAGLVGGWLLATGQACARRWARATGWVASAFFLAGLLVSMWASQVNWGGVFLAEPRYLTNFAVLLAALVVQLLAELPLFSSRVLGGLYLMVAGALLLSLRVTPLILHPANPVRASNALPIQLTFAGFFLLFLAAAGWMVVRLEAASRPSRRS